jgi:hypothetical protein
MAAEQFETAIARVKMLSMHIDSTVFAAGLASAVALIGYLGSQRIQRVERRAQVFAQAMRAVDQLQELPYLIWRRSGSSPDTVQRLGERQSELLQDVRYFVNLIRIENLEVARVYHLLARRVRRQMHANRRIAWDDPLIGSRRKLTDHPPFQIDIGPELQLCIDSMRAANSWAPSLRYPGIRNRRRVLEARDNLGESSSDWFVPLERMHW